MKKSTFAIIVALVVALCVPAVAFAALAPSPVFAPAEPIETARSAMQSKVDPAPAPEAPAEEAPAPQAQPDGSSAYGYYHPEGRFGTCGGYVDADGDGLCDTCGAASRACPNYVADNGSGACGSYGGSCPRGAGACSGYADADGDGICDNCLGNGANCPGYADADGNGVCDSYESGTAGRGHRGNGHGRGHGCMR